MDILFYLIVFALMALGAVALMWVAKGYMNGQSPSAAIFGARPERRLGIIEQANVDGRRRLLLIRRDNVEHLIMTGGPVDVVVETGIGERRVSARVEAQEPVAAQPVFARTPRSFGQASDRAPEQRVPERAAE